jgi:hypothetical protein
MRQMSLIVVANHSCSSGTFTDEIVAFKMIKELIA